MMLRQRVSLLSEGATGMVNKVIPGARHWGQEDMGNGGEHAVQEGGTLRDGRGVLAGGGLVMRVHLPRVFGLGEAICLPRSAGV